MTRDDRCVHEMRAYGGGYRCLWCGLDEPARPTDDRLREAAQDALSILKYEVPPAESPQRQAAYAKCIADLRAALDPEADR